MASSVFSVVVGWVFRRLCCASCFLFSLFPSHLFSTVLTITPRAGPVFALSVSRSFLSRPPVLLVCWAGLCCGCGSGVRVVSLRCWSPGLAVLVGCSLWALVVLALVVPLLSPLVCRVSWWLVAGWLCSAVPPVWLSALWAAALSVCASPEDDCTLRSRSEGSATASPSCTCVACLACVAWLACIAGPGCAVVGVVVGVVDIVKQTANSDKNFNRQYSGHSCGSGQTQCGRQITPGKLVRANSLATKANKNSPPAQSRGGQNRWNGSPERKTRCQDLAFPSSTGRQVLISNLAVPAKEPLGPHAEASLEGVPVWFSWDDDELCGHEDLEELDW